MQILLNGGVFIALQLVKDAFHLSPKRLLILNLIDSALRQFVRLQQLDLFINVLQRPFVLAFKVIQCLLLFVKLELNDPLFNLIHPRSHPAQ